MRYTYLYLLGAALPFLALGCGTSDEGQLCSAVAPEGERGCDNPFLNAGPHPCDESVQVICAGSADPACPSTAMSTCATDYYLRNYVENALRECDFNHPNLPIDKELELSLYRHSNIPDSAVVSHAKGLQAYYAPNRLVMHTHAIAGSDRIRYAITGNSAAINRALLAVGIPPTATSLTPEQEAVALAAIGDVMFSTTREFFARHSLPAEAKVNVVVIDQIVSPDMVDLMDINGTVVGLGLSPALLASSAAESETGQSLNTMLQVADAFTPTLFVGNSDILRLDVNFEHVVAHEMGHALGLPHVEETGNLMEPSGDFTCRHWLSQEQIDLMGPFADAFGSPRESFRWILDARRTVLQHILEQRPTERK